jgi:hypothetical protein
VEGSRSESLCSTQDDIAFVIAVTTLQPDR